MNLHLLYPVLPPVVDGIGDYTARLTETLVGKHRVTIWTDRGAYDPVTGAAVAPAYGIDGPGKMGSLAPAVLTDPPDWLVVQYNPFSYGRWGFNPSLPAVIHKIRRAGVRVALMVHEPYVPFTDWRNVVMGSWHRLQLRRLIQASEVVFFSIDPWTRVFRRRWPEKHVVHLPVGSNIPDERIPRDAARQALGIAREELVAGVFGSAHPSRLIGFVGAALDALCAGDRQVRVVCIGTAGEKLRQALNPAITITDAGVLPPRAVSAHFSAMDLYLSPFRKGVSTRRGSFIVGLQHGIATLSTYGEHTGALLQEADGRAFLLAPDSDPRAYARMAAEIAADPLRCSQIAGEGRHFFERHLAWERIASRMIDVLANADTPVSSPRILTESSP